MEDENVKGWERYYSALKGREPRPLFRKLMMHLDQGAKGSSEPKMAVDLGCGDGTETLALLDNGWRVFAIDSQPAAITRLLKKTSGSQKQQLRTENVTFEKANLPSAELFYAGLSLLFCSPDSFPMVWEKIVQSILPSGLFAGHFFGDRDEWASEPDMTFLTLNQTQALFERFVIEDFNEVDELGDTATQGPKHWHIFEVIARRIS